MQAAAETRATAPSVVPPPGAHVDLGEAGDGEGEGDKREGGATESSGAASGEGGERDAGVGVLAPSTPRSTGELGSSAEMASAEQLDLHL